MKVASAVISLVLGCAITFQSCVVTGLGAIADPESKAGLIGMLVGLLLMVGGGFAFKLPKAAMVISLICAGLAAIEATNDFGDMKVWAVVCLAIAAMEFAASRKPKPQPPATTVP
ncbi:MAG: hypothetical protein RDU89_07035 [bacterium]|nr:hypothetical protein [bacterium]